MQTETKSRSGAFLASILVLLLAGGFLFYALAARQAPPGERLVFHTAFNSANGLKAGAAVTLAGVTVGRVTAVTLNPETAMAEVSFSVDARLHLPADTSVSIGSAEATADDALTITPGHSSGVLTPGGTIEDARDPVSLEQRISNYIFSGSRLNP